MTRQRASWPRLPPIRPHGHRPLLCGGQALLRRRHPLLPRLGHRPDTIDDPDFATALRERPCTNTTCGCHIGYVHLDDLKLYDVFGAGVLERIPAQPIWRRRALPVLSCKNP
jgi:hypothetical protein